MAYPSLLITGRKPLPGLPAFNPETEHPRQGQISRLQVNYCPRTPGARTSPAGRNPSFAGLPVVKPPKRALFACPCHSALELRQPVVKTSEQAQANNRINFISIG